MLADEADWPSIDEVSYKVKIVVDKNIAALVAIFTTIVASLYQNSLIVYSTTFICIVCFGREALYL